MNLISRTKSPRSLSAFLADRSIPSSAAFDVTIMYKLLRNYGPNISPPSKGWGKKPDIGQKLPTDDVERIRLYRNEVEHKTPTTSLMEKDDFELKWKDLSQVTDMLRFYVD